MKPVKIKLWDVAEARNHNYKRVSNDVIMFVSKKIRDVNSVLVTPIYRVERKVRVDL